MEQLLLTLMIGMPVMADPVQRFLAAGGVAVDIADIGLLDASVVDAGVGERRAGGRLAMTS